MPRTTDSTLIAALAGSPVQMALFAQIGFATSTAYVWSGVGNVTWNGQTWTGIGSFLDVGQIEGGTTVEARGTSIGLSGFDPTVLAPALSEFQLGLVLAVYIGVYVSGSLYGTPLVAWVGRTDEPTIELSGKDGRIGINSESVFVAMNNAVDRRYSTQDQQMTWPQDLGMAFVDSIQEITTYWMQYPNNTNNV